ncbi:FKBP-type peptidyl-prolyl cis-trans isomerase [Pedobacter cryoconitis]|uniref:FKBP-type peptidyl-prolyl cis-trans isomerase n=1 Tax=Pedobacter cryoconitis TaxID=188932 RepID=UPI00185C899F|nr:FKBP-type peptidyl-prolyl cis-trans isomerase [Pedobacter cryoconitis]MBB5646288.1 FKBP-type peptidyl-prolyl cis-trans isomerase/thiol-disulfide isomerase/thioredoxin [Pedobacter cryoconitis]
MRLINILILMPFLTIFGANAQQNSVVPDQKLANLPNLSIGDSLPDFVIGKIINTNKKIDRTANYKNKLLIIDFWATGCAGCVLALPKMDSLQKQFGQKIKILPVTYEKEANVLTFWKNNINTKKTSLSSVVEDNIFAAYFRHRTIPHEVWVYNGKVVGITSSDYVDSNNIKMVLSGQQNDWPVKNDFYIFDGKKQPLFAMNPNQIDTVSTFVKYSAISDYKEGANSEGFGASGIVRDSRKRTVRAFFVNHPIYNAYLINWSRAINFGDLVRPSFLIQPNQIVWEVEDKSRYIFVEGSGASQGWLKTNGICFESLNIDTGQTDADISKATIADLDRLLGLHARWEKRKEKVLVLLRTDKSIPLKSKHSLTDEYDNRLITHGSMHQLRDSPVSTLTKKMNEEAGNPYVFDETSYIEKVDLDLNFSSWTDIVGINKALQPYGLALKEEDRVVDKFVFTEVNRDMLVNGKKIDEAKDRRVAKKGLKDPSNEENDLFLSANKKKAGVVTLPSGLQYKIIRQGNGVKPTLTDKVSVNYTAMLVNGKIFDSSLEKGIPYVIDNISNVIKGWTEALQLMPVGSKWIIYVPADLAYGASSNSGKFPKNSTMIFELELLKIRK